MADVVEEFRDVCMRNYRLDPAQYVSSPQLSWDAMLLNTNCTLDLISYPELFSMVDAGIRGGVSIISSRRAKANNPYMATFDPLSPPRLSYTSMRTTSTVGRRASQSQSVSSLG